MAVQKRPADPELDLDATAELPVMDFDDAGTLEAPAIPESAIATDVFPSPVVPAGVADLADSLRDVEQRLQRKIERVTALEADLAAATREAVDLRAQLDQSQRAGAERESSQRTESAAIAQREADLQRELMSVQGNLAEARSQLQTQHAALTESQQQSQQRASLQRDQEHDLLELRRRSERLHEALSTWQGFRAVSESMLADSEARLLGADADHVASLQDAQTQGVRLQEELNAARQQAAAQIATLEQSLAAAGQLQQAGAAELQTAIGNVERLTAELATSHGATAQLQQQLDELRAVEEKARSGAALFDEQQQQIASLRLELEESNERLRKAEGQIRNAGDRVHRLESEAHASAALLGNLQQNMQRLSRDDTGSRPALQPPPAQSVLRVLIRQEGGSDVVYPLTRRTSVGRTSENDIQIDATFISRHHAVLLSNPDHCIVEDLNSTNGVLVNGRRVGRQILHDGDTVTFGKTEFRYQQRT
jgi:chromosome segregation ATPase